MALAARIINIVVLTIVGIILVGIVLYVLGANDQNVVVAFLLGLARFFVAPFNSLFELNDNNAQVALNWGIAMLVYLIVGIFITRMLERTADRRVGSKD